MSTRIQAAQEAIRAHAEAKGDGLENDPQDQLIDLLTDLRHLAAGDLDLDFAQAVRVSKYHHQEDQP
jgi:hypothetical protein